MRELTVTKLRSIRHEGIDHYKTEIYSSENNNKQDNEMEEKYKPILPEDLFLTALDRQPTEVELWMGVPSDFHGNRASGNNFMDLFAYLIRKHGRKDIQVYAKLMGVSSADLYGAIRAMSGIGAAEWRNRYLVLEAKELLEKTTWEIRRISARLGFSQPSVFSKLFQTYTQKQPFEWRNNWRRGTR